jgi:hypothetical protein
MLMKTVRVTSFYEEALKYCFGFMQNITASVRMWTYSEPIEAVIQHNIQIETWSDLNYSDFYVQFISVEF